jgi:V/A-type H+-transporting ATPase subunit D
MAQKIKLTRPELKKQRDALGRFGRFLPMLKLKQQQLQLTMRQISKDHSEADEKLKEAKAKFESYKNVLNDIAGIDVRKQGSCSEVKTTSRNIAGVTIPIFEEAIFPEVSYSLFATPAWVDAALVDLRAINLWQSKMDVLQKQYDLLNRELTKIIQRVNLFEKVKIPQAKDNIRRIGIKLSDEMAAAVGRAKIAKSKLVESDSQGAINDEMAAECA